MARIFTTGAVARMCNVAPRTVSKWFDSGKLKGYRIPGSQDRRIPRAQLIRFLKEYEMPIPPELAEADVVLLVGLSETLADRLAELLPAADGFQVEAVAGLFDAGLAAHELCPKAVVLDGSVGRSELARMVAGLRANGTAKARLVAVVGADWQSADTMGYDDVFADPVDPAALADLIRAGRED